MKKTDEEMIREMDEIEAEDSFEKHFVRVEVKPSTTRTVTFGVRVSPGEAEEFAKAARARGLTLSEYVRSLMRAVQDGSIDLDKAEAVAAIREKTRELAAAVAKL
jgi:hypothetical protein